MTDSVSIVRDDFDRLALLGDEGWNHNHHYHGFLLRHVPVPCGQALEIGCGTGVFARLLAERAAAVLALDLSPHMIRLARERSTPCPNIEYVQADVTACPLPVSYFDCIATIATLHHLPLHETLEAAKRALRPQGVLLVLDLFRTQGLADKLVAAVAIPISVALRLAKRRRLREPRALREAWRVHGEHDRYPTLREVRRVCAKTLPSAEVRRHLLWRYSIVWRKPHDAA